MVRQIQIQIYSAKVNNSERCDIITAIVLGDLVV